MEYVRKTEKSLITRADDLASSHSANIAICKVADKGIVKNVSVMACGPCLEEAAEMLAGNKNVTFGMHSVINAEWDKVVWGPVAPIERVPSLIDKRGVFYQDVLELAAAKPSLDEIILELRCQLERLRKVGFDIKYIDTHMCPDADIEGLGERFDRFVESEGLLNYRYFNDAVENGGEFSHKREVFYKTIHEMEGQHKLVMHPARSSEEMKMTGNHNYSGEYIAWEREDDFQFYNDPAVLKYLQDEGVKLLSYTQAVPLKEPYCFSLWRKD